MLKPGSEISNDRKNPLERKMANKKKISKKDILEAYSKKLSLEDMGEFLNISKLSSAIYLERLLKKGAIEDISHLIDSRRVSEIEELLLNSPTSSLKKIIAHTKDNFFEYEIRLVRGALIWKNRDNY